MLYLDTNILIYLFEKHDRFSNQVASILEKYTNQNKQLITSVITVTEFLAGTTSSTLQTLHQVPNLSIIFLDSTLAEQAAQLQRKEKINIGDAIHLATALQHNALFFFTNDRPLSKIVEKYIPVINLSY